MKVHKQHDIEDWGIRQLRALGYIGMREMILVFRVMLYSHGRKRRWSDREIHLLVNPAKKPKRKGAAK